MRLRNSLAGALATTGAVLAVGAIAVGAIGAREARVAEDGPALQLARVLAEGVEVEVAAAELPKDYPPPPEHLSDIPVADWIETVQTHRLVEECMAAQGFEYAWEAVLTDSLKNQWWGELAPERVEAFTLALHGTNDTVPYDWRDAGCWGAAVHEMGNDDAH